MSLVTRSIGAGILFLVCAWRPYPAQAQVTIEGKRDREESSNIAAVTAAQTRVAAPKTVAAQVPQPGSSPAAPSRGATPPPASQGTGSGSQGPASPADIAKARKTLDDLARTEAAMKNPLLTWTAMRNNDVEARTYVRVPSDTVRTNAYCGSNGLNVKFSLQSLVSDPLNFDWYEDRDSDALVADVRVVPDNVAPHVARGYAEEKNDTTFFANNLLLLFYDAATRERAERGGLGSLFQQANERILESWLRTTAGSLASLLEGRTIQVELPIKDWENPLVLDLNPQDKVLHAFAADCNARLSGSGASPQPAPRQTAPRGGAQR